MRYFVGLVLALVLVGLPLNVSAQETSAPKPYLELEVDSSVLKMTQSGRGIGGIDPILGVRGEGSPKRELSSHEKHSFSVEGLSITSPMATVASLLSVSAQAGEGVAASEPASLASIVHAHRSLPPLLTLQASDYVVDVDPLSAQPTVVPKKEEVPPTPEERERSRRNRNIGLGIGLGVGIPLVIGIAAGVTAANFSF